MALTNAEEQVMKYLWKLKKAFFKDLIAAFSEPKPATTTINTLLKRMIDKGYVDFKLYGNSREYFPLISKEKYFSKQINGMISDFFDNSASQFASFFTKEAELNDKDLRDIRKIIDEQLNDQEP